MMMYERRLKVVVNHVISFYMIVYPESMNVYTPR